MQNAQAQLELKDNCQTIDFETARVHLKEKGYWVVTVTGTKPNASMKIDLVPMMYTRQPEYWGIAVRAYVIDPTETEIAAPFEVKLPLSGCKGVKGIEIVGASKQEKIDIAC